MKRLSLSKGEELVREFVDSDAEERKGYKAEGRNSKVSHIPLVRAYTR